MTEEGLGKRLGPSMAYRQPAAAILKQPLALIFIPRLCQGAGLLSLDPWIGSGSPGGLDVEVPSGAEESGVLRS